MGSSVSVFFCLAAFPFLFAPSGQTAIRAESLPLEILAGQLVGIAVTEPVVVPQLEMWVHERAVGMIVLYRSSMPSAETVRDLSDRIRTLAPSRGLAPLVATDQEGGVVMRLTDAMIPGNMALGASGSADLARRAGAHVGCVLRSSGITVNLAPVVDVVQARDPGETGTRSFGDDPHEVARLASAYHEGLTEAGVLAVAKHFPGQGGASGDPHSVRSTDSRRVTELKRDLIPFRALIANGVAGIMAGHVMYPNWPVAGEAPASLSAGLLQTVLRKDLGFDGLIFTDVLHMRGVAGVAEAGELAVRAIEAGADMVLTSDPVDREAAYRGILEAIRTGRLPKRRVHSSVDRVLRAKRVSARGATDCHPDTALSAEIARSAVTRIGPQNTVIDPEATFFAGIAGPLADRFPPERRLILPMTLTGNLVDRFAKEIRNRFSGEKPLVVTVQNDSQAELVRRVSAILPETPIILVAFGFPGSVSDVPAASYVFSYSFLPPSQEAVARVLANEACAPGKLPMDVPGIAPRGKGDRRCLNSEARESP